MTILESQRESGLLASQVPMGEPVDIDAPAGVENRRLLEWVAEMAQFTGAERVVWCDGSQAEWYELTRQMMASGMLIQLNPDLRPNSFLARSTPSDVARVEERTFICTASPADAGPTNNWRDPVETKTEVGELFRGSMRGRTMYVVPFSMGPVGGPISQLGVQLTDSPYAVVNLRIMTRMGSEALAQIGPDTEWVAGLHSVGYPLIDDQGNRRDDVAWPCNDTKYICHFPDTLEIWSYGSGYGGNALLSKKCFALRIASVMARNEGWLAEHMLLLKLTSPEGRAFHVAAAFPSACGKTNLAMLQPTIPGWKAETIGDDIAWLRPGPDGRLRAINPEAGFFGVAPGTSYKTNPIAMDTIWGNTIFTNCALTDDGDVWWEGMTETAPDHLIDWRGNDWTPASGRPAAHPNARFTAPAAQCPILADDWYESEGVAVDAILFGGRRASTVPLVTEAYDWQQGVFMGATISSERTAAAEGTVGELRRDPFAMLPFCGYNMADHWAHWLRVGRVLGDKAPRIYKVNWFRKGKDGSYLWPGFGENSRVLEWVCRRVAGEADAVDRENGRHPVPAEFDVQGLELPDDVLAELFAVNRNEWIRECDLTEDYFETFKEKLPAGLSVELGRLRRRIQ